jgi:3-dehydroquinate synthase
MAKLEVAHQLTVDLLGNSYPIFIGRNILQDMQFLPSLYNTKQVLVVTNDTVAPLYLQLVQEAYHDIQCDVVILPDGEIYKNEQSLFVIYETLLKKQHHRDTLLIALGGGVVGDITGFAAATYQRGVSFIQVPTSLLAQVDASVGGKTAINHALGKNMIGCFYQPKAVVISLDTLYTLPAREFHAGFAEVIKYGLLEGGSFWSELGAFFATNPAVNHKDLAHLIYHCCAIKAKYVEQDEKEHANRALLNLGHTFAHALEAYTDYTHWLHGEAVAIGLFAAANLSLMMGYLLKADVENLEQMLKNANLVYKIPRNIELQKLVQFMYVDKKIKNNKLRFVLIRQPGVCFLDETVTEDKLIAALNASLEGEY